MALAASIKDLMQKHSVKKISISDIVEGCDMNRQSFYYHFKDKYDLVNWIFYTEFYLAIKEQPMQCMDLFEKICEYFYENKKFYQNSFTVRGQNSFSEYFGYVLHYILESQLNELFKDNENVEFYTNFYTDAIRIAIERWLREDTQIPPQHFAELTVSALEIGVKSINDSSPTP